MTNAVLGRFRPTFWATLATIVSLAVLLGLGFWQLQRLAWKENLIAELAARGGAAPIALPQRLSEADDLEFRAVRLNGRPLPVEPFFRGPTSLKRQVGYHLLVPFQLDDGRQVLIDLGFLPVKTGDWAGELAAAWRAIRPVLEGAPAAALDGILRRGGWQGSDFLRPVNDPATRVWHYVDLPAMAGRADLDQPLTAFYVVALSEGLADDRLTRVRPGVDLKNDHLEYALTWFSLAGVLVVIYLIFHWRKPGADR